MHVAAEYGTCANVLAEIKISDKIEFDGGAHELRSASKETLRAVGKILMTRADVRRLTIEGHTCRGPQEWNMVRAGTRRRSRTSAARVWRGREQAQPDWAWANQAVCRSVHRAAAQPRVSFW